jgi:hypothetical protein
MILIGLASVLAAIVATLPASIIARFLPPGIVAEEFSGSVWHGSAGKIRVTGRDAGALEWWLHPASLLGMVLSADLHWVKVGFVIDAAVKVDRHGFAAHGIKGGGPIEDLRDLGVAAGWRGIAEIHLSKLQGDFASPHSAVGDLKVSNLTAAQFADGANLGGYLLQIPEGSAGTDGTSGQVTDTGGPLEAQITLHYTAKDRASSSLERCASAPRRRPRCAASCRISRSIAGAIRRVESPWIWNSLSRSDCACLPHVEEIQLVAVEISKVAGVETVAARPRSSFILGAEFKGLAVQCIDLGRAIDHQRNHDAIAHRGGFLVEGFGNPQSGLILAHRPGDELLGFHHAFAAHCPQQRIVERRRARQIVGTECDVADHDVPPWC